MLSDSRLLFKLWLKNPFKIGAVAVSSPELAAAMARHIPNRAEGYVVELGGGTGPVTRAILECGVARNRLVWSSATRSSTGISPSVIRA